MAEIRELSLVALVDALDRGEVTPTEVAEAHIAAMEAAKDLNLFITETPDKARAMASDAEVRRAAGAAHALDGVPVAVKDLFCTDGIRTTAGSRILEDFVPPYESTVTANLWATGATLLGKTNLDEFAMGSSNETSYFGNAINPWRRKGDKTALVPGGSSGGSAAAVAAGIVPLALGTDTGGSIRQPASLSGIVGVKPTYGRCSRWGTVAFASSLDQAGVFARTVEDAAVGLGAIAGHDPKDSTSVPRDVPNYAVSLATSVAGLKIGVPTQYRVAGMPHEVADLWDEGCKWLADAGAEIVEIDLPHTEAGLATYYIVAPAEASSNLARYDGVKYGLRVDGDDLADMYAKTRGQGFGAEVRRRIMVGTYVLSAGYYDAYYLKAQQVRTLIARDFARAFETVDAILTPTTTGPAFGLGEKTDDPIAMYLNDVFTVPASLAGIPGISVPAGLSDDGLPLGLQVLTKAFDEPMMFRVAQAIETAAAFDAAPTRWWEG